MAYLTNFSFTRQQVGELTGVSDDVLGYWMREGLLVSEAPASSGKRAHRRFSFVQLHVAVLLNELRRYGTNVDGLRNMADICQRAIVLGREMTGWNSRTAIGGAALAEHRKVFREGRVEKSPIYNVRNADGEVVKAASFDEWLASINGGDDPEFTDAEIRLSTDPRLADRDNTFLLSIFSDLINPTYDQLGQPGPHGRKSEWFWLIYPIEGGWYIRGREDGRISLTEFADQTSYISINVSRLIRQIWQAQGERA